MERLTRPNVIVDETVARYMGEEVKIQDINDWLLDLILNGPTLNAVNKDVLRQIIRQLYDELKKREDAFDLMAQGCIVIPKLQKQEAPALKVVCGATGVPCARCKPGPLGVILSRFGQAFLERAKEEQSDEA